MNNHEYFSNSSNTLPVTFKATDAIKLQTHIVQTLWKNLTENERIVYEQIVNSSDSKNQIISNIILIAAYVGIHMENHRLSKQVEMIKENGIKNANLNSKLIQIMSGLMLGLSSVSLILLAIIVF